MLKIKFIPFVFLFSLTNLFCQAPALFVKGNTLQTIHNDTIMLRGASLGDLASQNYYKMGGKNALDMLDVLTDTSKGWYINLVRIPIHPDVNWGGDQTWPKINPVHFDTTQLRPFIDKATELGLYVMIDLHYVHNSYGIDGMGVYVDKRLRDFWKFIAPRYANYENVMYELFNEPIDDCQDWNSWVDRAQGWVDLIRSYAPNIIWVGAPCWSQQIGGSALKPIKGGNIGYVSHFYPNSGVDYAIGEAKKAVAKAPVILGEWGWRQGKSSDLSKHPDYPEKIKNLVMQNGLSFCAWSATDDWEPGIFESDYETIDEKSHGPFLLSWLSEIKDLYVNDTHSQAQVNKDSLQIITFPSHVNIGDPITIAYKYHRISPADTISIYLRNKETDAVISSVSTIIDSLNVGLSSLSLNLHEELVPGEYLVEAVLLEQGDIIASDMVTVFIQPESQLLYVNGGSGSGRYFVGESVSISADMPPYGKGFFKWTGNVEVLESDTISDQSFTMPDRIISLTASYKDKTITTGIINEISNIRIFPNPLQQGGILQLNNAEPIDIIEILDISGKKVYVDQKKEVRGMIYITDIPAGLYFIRIDGRAEKLLIIE